VSTRVLPIEQASDAIAHSVWLDGPRETADNIGVRGYAYAPYAHVGEPIAIEPHVLILYVGGRTSIDRAIGRTIEHAEVSPGDLSMQSTRASSVWNWTHPIEVLHIYISPLHLRQMARRAFDETVRHVNARVQFGKPLAAFQMTQAALAEMATELDAARLLVYRAAWQRDNGQKAKSSVAMAKMHATEAAQRIIDRAVQLHGGLGVLRGGVVESLYREIRPLRIYEGTTEIQKLIIGESFVPKEEPA